MESAITKELRRLTEKYGGKIHPRDVVNEARADNSPLHNSFEWDDAKAGEAYRIEQARGIIQLSVTVLPNTNAPIRAFVSLSTDRITGGGYTPVESVVSDLDMRRIMLKDATTELEIFVRKFDGIKELLGVVAEAQKFIKAAKSVAGESTKKGKASWNKKLSLTTAE